MSEIAQDSQTPTNEQPYPTCAIVRKQVKEVTDLAGTRCEVAEEHYETKLEKLRNKGMDASVAAMEAKKDTLDVVGPKLKDSACKLTEILEEKLKMDTSRMDAATKTKHHNLCLRQAPKVYYALQKVAEVLDSLSTHPTLEVKGTFIGKVDARQVNVSKEEGAARLSKFKNGGSAE